MNWDRKKVNENQTIRFSVSEKPTVEVSSSYLQKCGILFVFFFCKKTYHRFVFILFFSYFSLGDCIDSMVLECCERLNLMEIKSSSAFLRGGGVLPWRNLSWRKIISMKGPQDSLALLKKKNNEKINKKCFSAWSKE